VLPAVPVRENVTVWSVALLTEIEASPLTYVHEYEYPGVPPDGLAVTEPVVKVPFPVCEAERLLVERDAVRVETLNEIETETLALSTVREAASVTVHFQIAFREDGALPEADQDTVAAVESLIEMESPLTCDHA
jgi:hypothetical protein